MKRLVFTVLFALPIIGTSQYTDVINSNRPGQSVSAYAVGKNVVQAEGGFSYEQRDHDKMLTESSLFGVDLSLRYGLLFESLEVNYDGVYNSQNITYTRTGVEDKWSNFSRNRLGLKYLLFDPYKNPEFSKPNLYSWKANHRFQWKNLIPAVSIYGGANFLMGDNPYYAGYPTFSPRAMVATQSRISPRVVLITNIAYDYIGTEFSEWSYIISLSHALRNPKWSIFIENQGIQSDRYSDELLRGGLAYLFNENFQVDLNFGTSFKNTPSRIFGALGASYRLDMHKDELKPIDDGDGIDKNAMKKKERKEKRKRGTGAEDIDLGPSKKEMRKQRKTEKKKAKENRGVIDF
ncbi:transporter [Flavobacteriaceae bacterium F89]|uniref:Transporter n=1 Tax=Cerina litoralis TaxID=2874477 RepID=A0AAE3EVZ7_9FLAO|nr:transporter [Cerina litoralis]MCG2461374.1 transporter [Cerina litoralis]